MIKNNTYTNNECYNTFNLQQEINYIDSYISYQKNLKNYISNIFDKLSLNIDENEKTDEIKDLFQKVFEVRLNLDCNIINLQNALQSLKKIEISLEPININQITEYKKIYDSNSSDIQKNTDSAKKLADNLYSFSNQKHKLSKKNKISPVPCFDFENIENNNTLKISERDGKVYLPYIIRDLKKILEENPDKYSGLNDLIEKKYIVPLKYYKNSSYARFREAYKLIREKEKGSISQALNLAFELLFNYNLDPAIISACKNIDELDIYLDCLDDNETDEFYCFQIVYEVTPLVKLVKNK